MSKTVTFQQFLDFYDIPIEKGNELLGQLESQYPDGAATIQQIQAIAAPYLTPENISQRVVAGLMEGWNTLRAGKGPARINPAQHFV